MGAGKQTEGRVSRRPKRQAPPLRAPAGRVVCSPAPVPPPAQPRGCKGRSPLHEITLILPLPAGKGVGGMGAGKKLKARLAGDPKGKPPCGFRNGSFGCFGRFFDEVKRKLVVITLIMIFNVIADLAYLFQRYICALRTFG